MLRLNFKFVLIILIGINILKSQKPSEQISQMEQKIRNKYNLKSNEKVDLIHNKNFKLNGMNVDHLFFKIDSRNKYILAEVIDQNHYMQEVNKYVFENYRKVSQIQFYLIGSGII